jgi:hypothetical protein
MGISGGLIPNPWNSRVKYIYEPLAVDEPIESYE